MEEPRGQRVMQPPLMRAGLAALAVPAVLGLLAVPGLLLEAPSWPAVVLMFVGFPLVLIAGEDGLAVGVVVTAAVWAPMVDQGETWWFEFSYGGVLATEVAVSRSELESGPVVVPDSAEEVLRQADLSPPPG